MIKTQCERIIDYINDFGSITSMEAMQDLGCMRLASRICDLKRRGYKIVSKTEIGKNRYGEPITYSRYFLEK
uniref:helix-turn-helix domain-containing protein n=1 Tax=Eubacterium sp. TaxID=142586 RepID=UPI0040253FDD